MTYQDLPETPEEYTAKLLIHMPYEDGRSAVFEIFDQDGNKAAFRYEYDTRKDGVRGYTLPGVDGVMTWDELREAASLRVAQVETEAEK